MPPPVASAKALFKEAWPIQDECLVDQNQTMCMESIGEDSVASNNGEEQEAESSSQSKEQLEEHQEEEDLNQDKQDDSMENQEQPPGKDNPEEDKVLAVHEASDNESSKATIYSVREVDPKEWRQIHDEWLHAAMRVAMGNTTLTTIPDIENVEHMERKPPASTLNLQPT